MKIGILSDSHGKTKRLERAIELLAVRGAQAILHCGDIGASECIEILCRAGVPAYAVSGNMDKHLAGLEFIAREAGAIFSSEAVKIPIGPDRYVIATHGQDERLLASLIEGEQFPYVCHGHTHRTRNERINDTRVINPGALYHNRKPRHPTCALLDTDDDTVEFIDVPR